MSYDETQYDPSYTDDAILPDGFDPNAEFYDFDAEVTENTGETEVPTTEPVAENTTEAVEETPIESTTTQPVEIPEAKVKVKYNHEERELSLDEAAVYAQKGMNYDKLDEKIRDYEAKNVKSERLAKQLGYDSAEEMIEAAASNYRNRLIKDLENAGNTHAMAEFLVDQRIKAELGDTETKPAPKTEAPSSETPAKQSDNGLSPERKAELDEFVKLYPGVVNLPPEVLKANANGVRLSVAYEQFKSKSAQQELAILKQNQAAAAKAPVTGSVGKAAPPSNEADDPFLKGFDDAY